LLKGAAVGLPLAAAPALQAAPALAQTAQFARAIDVLTYALQLKYLLAEFYRQGIAADLTSGAEGDWLKLVGNYQQQHVASLTQAFKEDGGTDAKPPAPNFAGRFDTRETFLETAFLLHETVMRAYIAMPPAPAFDETDVLREMSGIFVSDARAAAVLATILGKPTEEIYARGLPQGLPPQAVLETLSPFVAGPWAMAPGAAITE
jgi:hypothetical protein